MQHDESQSPTDERLPRLPPDFLLRQSEVDALLDDENWVDLQVGLGTWMKIADEQRRAMVEVTDAYNFVRQQYLDLLHEADLILRRVYADRTITDPPHEGEDHG